MRGSGDGHIGADHGVVPDIDMGIVHTGQMVVGIDHLPEMTVVSAEVGVEGGFDIHTLSAVSQHVL